MGTRFPEVKINYLRPWIKHGSHWINFLILTFMDENNENFTHLHKFFKKIISFDMKEKGGNLG